MNVQPKRIVYPREKNYETKPRRTLVTASALVQDKYGRNRGDFSADLDERTDRESKFHGDDQDRCIWKTKR